MENTSSGKSVSTKQFYGNDARSKTGKLKKYCNSGGYNPVPNDLKRLLGPTSTWKVFKKQAEVLCFTKNQKCGLMPFVFQQKNGKRLFLAAHPRWLWYYDSLKDPSCRCSYEIIPEYTVCKLYFDLEFETQCNPNHDGSAMVQTFLSIIFYFCKTVWHISIDKNYVLDLDSTTKKKFSRHLVFCLANAAFHDNYSVGRFVKYVCNEIRSTIKEIESSNEYCSDFMKEYNIKPCDILMLKVKNSKENFTLFCDEGVYTKNRHFRLFKSTKPEKNAPLILSSSNLYKSKYSESCNTEEQIFLDSLITYVPGEIDSISVLNFGINKLETFCNSHNVFQFGNNNNYLYSQCLITSVSPYPEVDKYINQLVNPGHIWRSNFFQTSAIIVYDIVGYRYCGNIRRHHRSNNIKLIVDIKQCCFYQKCYDPECSMYRSESSKLPPEINFHLESDELDNFVSEFDRSVESAFDSSIDEKDLAEIVDIVENLY